MTKCDAEARVEASTTFLTKESGGCVNSHCHAVRYRLSNDQSIDRLRYSFNTLLRELSVQDYGEEVTDAALWVETIGSNADANIAEQRRRAELRRTLPGSLGAAWRTIVLQYRDGAADLIVVARRSVIDFTSLQFLANAIISDQPVLQNSVRQVVSSTPENEWAGLLPEDSPLDVSWGMGDGPSGERAYQSVELAGGRPVDLPVLIAAVGVAAARYAGSNMYLLATVSPDPGRNSPRIGAFEGLAVLKVAAHERMPGSQVVSESEPALATHLCWHREDLKAVLRAKYGPGAAVAIGVFEVESWVPGFDDARPDEYLPFLSPPFPLTIYLRRKKDQSQSITCNYDTGVFDKSVVEHFARSTARLTDALRADIELQQLELLSAAERKVIAGLGRSAPQEPVQRQRLGHAFSDIARQYPSQTALIFGEMRLSYQELEQRANRAAQVLRAGGVRDGDRVGVCVERSIELVVTILAVTKAGAAYVPIDTEYPMNRLVYITTDAAVSVVVTSRSDFPQTERIRMLFVADLASPGEETPLVLDESPGTEEDIAYIIYTSGSTGRPKGVAVPHKNVMNLVAATKSDFGLSTQDVWTLFHASSFDFSVWEIWGCFLTGGSLVVIPFSTSRAPLEFQDVLVKERVTVLNQTPSAFAQLVDADRERPLPLSLRLIIFGGEPLSPRTLLPWLDRWPERRCRLVNMFGITETTVHVTFKTITRDDALKASRSVGHPLPGWYIYVMDAAGRILPPGVSGEICVGGLGVAAFYVNNPSLTAARFVPDPFSPGRLYCSGDKGRLRADGQLEHLGRIDSQVKIRGFRIELDEIRAVLLDIPGVTAAAVVFRQENREDAATARLDAYVATANRSAEEVRRHLSRILPDYMMPATVTVLSSLPLTANGKIDARLLRESAALQPSLPREVPPASSEPCTLAQVLQEIWQRVLNVPVDLDDNFFDLGGNSLYAVRLWAAMREQQLPPIAMRDIYVNQTVRKLAHSMEDRRDR